MSKGEHFSTPDDLAHFEKIGASTNTTGWMQTFGATHHYKYPQSVGADSVADNINFNSHDSSKYAKKRMTAIDEATHEPYMLFEFMKIREDKAEAKIAEKTEALGTSFYDYISRNHDGNIMNKDSSRSTTGNLTGGKPEEAVDLNVANSWVDKSIRKVSSFFKDLVNTAERDYIGSCALYMPTDIQINDQMVYNEDTRKIGALGEAINNGEAKMGDVLNKQVLLDPAVLTLMTAGAAYASDKIGFGSSTITAVTALASYGVGDIMQTELQRSTGKIMNPNELLRYQQTALRSFTFNWIFLPDNEYESNQATNIIKMFRKAAHATKQSSTMIIVPDHVVVSFHGAKDMIQIPPCYIESVNVTYNPNVSSFFKQNNAPVEIGLSLTLKEIVPIYADDVEDRRY
jgi:hypothetical protein